VAILYFVGAVLTAVGGVFSAIWFAINGDPYNWAGGRFRLAMATLTGTFFTVLALLAIAELIKLFIDIEHNTRVGAISAAGTTAANTPGDGKSRLTWMEGEETAEGALLRGH
jgi:hypothetical protein